jgi:hypothetical protein
MAYNGKERGDAVGAQKDVQVAPHAQGTKAKHIRAPKRHAARRRSAGGCGGVPGYFRC